MNPASNTTLRGFPSTNIEGKDGPVRALSAAFLGRCDAENQKTVQKKEQVWYANAKYAFILGVSPKVEALEHFPGLFLVYGPANPPELPFVG